MAGHIPVLPEESVAGLHIQPDAKIIDGTIDGGGHTERFLQQLGPDGQVLGIDWDPDMEPRLRKRFPGEHRLKLINANFGSIESIARSFTFWPDAVFLDLGLSSFQLQARPDGGQASGRGFSFQNSEPLEMTFHPDTHPNARELVNTATEEELEEVIRTYGEEWQARKIARAIVEARKIKAITRTDELVAVIAGAVRSASWRRRKIHPATKTFQALRIYINGELENLENALKGSWNILK
ncbi:MAG: 16S rRNA (cytosine(1402)-N(4))-methyltransferase RsmH, partial [Patescibacteria group bacterium]